MKRQKALCILIILGVSQIDEFKTQTELIGHSGCKIYLMEDENQNRFIRKFSKNIIYNERLRLQYEKQKNFNDTTIHSPKVLCSGINNEGLFYFDMEYIRGITLAEYMKKIEVSKISNIVNILTSQIDTYNTKKENDNPNIFINKINNLSKKVDSPITHKCLDFLANYEWKHFPNTFCHGDLTLENIMICQEKIYFIDFLDSFYDCFILDLATLFQDVYYMWCYRFEKDLDTNTKIRLMVFRDLLLCVKSTALLSKKSFIF